MHVEMLQATTTATTTTTTTTHPPPGIHTMEDPPLTSLSLTHVYYNPADHVSRACAFLALVPQALMIVYVSLIWSTRELEILLMFAGQLACEALNWLLKRCIREERPSRRLHSIPSMAAGYETQGGCARLIRFTACIEMHGKGYGMPSSHAQFAAFFSTYLALFLLVRHTPHPPSSPHRSPTHTPIPFWQRFVLSLLAIASAAAVAQSRIYLSYHKPRQVYVGAGVGIACAVAWFVVTGLARRYGLVDWLLAHPVLRAVRMRDLVVNEDLVDAGWDRWESRRRKRMADGLANGSLAQAGKKGR